ncbi:hypothetical protein K501DRAFT_284879 [Backusella circina FSU 941]|nr:hypothetical protein K501DRAFT_284879 [Backusella circina FSU 941]
MTRNKSGKNRAAQRKANMKKNKKTLAVQKEQEAIHQFGNYSSEEDQDDYDDYSDEYDDDDDDNDESEMEVEEFNYAMTQLKELLKEKPHLVPHCYELFRTMEEKRAEIEAEKAVTCNTCHDTERAEVENLLKVVDFLTGSAEQKNTNQANS